MSLLDGNYPKTYKENLAERYLLLARAKTDLVFRAKIKELFHRDILFAFNAFFDTLDVRKNPHHHQPFCTYPYQDKAILKVQGKILGINGEEKGDLGIKKSRDMGWSWVVILVFLHTWLNPKGGGDFLLGSRIEDYVDKKGDMRALLEKARYALYRLPKWIRPVGFNKKQHDNFMRLVNPETGASITGESNNPNWSTGGRYLAGLLDEFAKWEGSDKSAWTAAGDATPCRIALSTPFGAGGHYYEIIHGEKLEVITTHWSLHPEKAVGLYCVWPKLEEAGETVDSQNWVGLRSIWYDAQEKRRKPSEMRQELDIQFVGSGNPVFEGKALQRIIKLLDSSLKPVAYLQYLDGSTELQSCKEPDDSENHVVIYEEPSLEFSYLIACDVAEGKEDGDYSVVKVMKRQTEDVVASFYGTLDEIRLADIVVGLTLYYSTPKRQPWWAVETVGPGLSTFDQVVEKYNLPNAFMMPTGFDSVLQKPTFRKGWWTGTTSRNALIGGIVKWLIEGTGQCNARCTRELTTFVRNKAGKAGAKAGCFDDEVMSLGILLQMNEIVPFDEDEFEIPRMENGLPLSTFKLEKKEKPLSIEERCFATLVKKKEYQARESDWNDPLVGQLEDLGFWD